MHNSFSNSQVFLLVESHDVLFCDSSSSYTEMNMQALWNSMNFAILFKINNYTALPHEAYKV